MRFYVDQFGTLKAEEGRQQQILITVKGFLQSDTASRCQAYLRTIAKQLNEHIGDDDAIDEILTEAEYIVGDAKTSERFMETPIFPNEV